MKKTLLAAALVAGFAGVAHAESSVTLYGLVDAGYGYQNVDTKFRGDHPSNKFSTRNFGVRSGVMNGNRWGLKGTEDLGNGTSAIFVLESGFDLGDGTQSQGETTRHKVVTDVVVDPITGAVTPVYGTVTTKQDRLFGRQAYVGLTGESWGTFTIGRQYNAADAFVAPIDPFVTGGGLAGAHNIFGDSLSARYDRAIKYVSPNFAGFQFGLGIVHDDTRYKVANPSLVEKDRLFGVTAGLGYTNGPIYLGASFDYVNVKNTLNGVTQQNDKTKAWNIGGTYDFDVVKLHLMYGGQADGTIGGTGEIADSAISAAHAIALNTNAGDLFGDGLKQHSWMAGLTAPVGDAGKVMFSYAGNTVKNKDILPDVKVKSHNFALGYRHSLSKRTSVYGVASYGWSNAKERYTGFNGKTKVKATQAVVGLQHRF